MVSNQFINASFITILLYLMQEQRGEVKARAKEGMVKVSVSNGLIKNNFSYATVRTQTVQELEAGSPARPPQPAALLGMKFRDRELPKTPMEATPSSTLSTPPDSATSTSIHSSTPSCLEVEGRPWYRRVDRKKAEELVREGRADGCFVVRDSRHGGEDSPLTLTLYNTGKVFNISIRLRPDGQVALGKEKVEEVAYSSVVAMVDHHRAESMTLTAGSSQQEHSKTRLTCWPP